ncbi:hypothetical protein LCGC14_0427370 [marine sediment metagenome]|uniref:DNA (cytosine-5-)-methyltransferase n=1 Tax=marine sediment metagenome TaxID=412755 RepID=A0A0F9T715_9ZZZZ
MGGKAGDEGSERVVALRSRSGELFVASLCAGGGGMDMGVRLAIPDARTVVYVERELRAVRLLETRMLEGALHPAPIWPDLKTFDGRRWRGCVDLLTASYPCQPFSQAGKRLGEKDPRHLWPEVARIISESEVPMVLLENVAGHLILGFSTVQGDLQRMGYRHAAGLFTAEECGFPHLRKRLFCLAVKGEELDDAMRGGLRKPASGHSRGVRETGEAVAAGCAGEDVADDRRQGGNGQGAVGTGTAGNRAAVAPGGADVVQGWGHAPPPCEGAGDRWKEILDQRPDLTPAAEPEVHGVAYGMASRLDRLDRHHVLGNAVVPLVVAHAVCSLWIRLMEGDED